MNRKGLNRGECGSLVRAASTKLKIPKGKIKNLSSI